jgi:glycerol-3-phosphate dehydrogenase
VGGKLTTARRLARKATSAVADKLGTTERLARPRALPARGPDRVSFLPSATQENLRDRYGHRAAAVAAYAAVDPELAKPISPLHPDIGAQVVYGVEHEGARTIGDVLLRRTPVGLTHDLGRAAAPNVARIMAQRLDWTEDEAAQAVRDYEMELHRTFTVFDRGAGTTPPASVGSPAESTTDLAESGD